MEIKSRELLRRKNSFAELSDAEARPELADLRKLATRGALFITREIINHFTAPLNELGHPAFSLQLRLTADEVAFTLSHRRSSSITRRMQGQKSQREAGARYPQSAR